MNQRVKDYLGLNEPNVIGQDEVLVALQHRAAYKTIRFMSGLLILLGAILMFIVTDERWNIAGYAIFGSIILTLTVFDLIQAYDGVFKGRSEIIEDMSLSKSLVHKRTLFFALRITVIYALVMYFIDGEFNPLKSIVQAMIFGVIMASMYSFRWHKAIKEKTD